MRCLNEIQETPNGLLRKPHSWRHLHKKREKPLANYNDDNNNDNTNSTNNDTYTNDYTKKQ